MRVYRVQLTIEYPVGNNCTQRQKFITDLQTKNVTKLMLYGVRLRRSSYTDRLVHTLEYPSVRAEFYIRVQVGSRIL